jgi:hypothetical protein
LSDHPRAQLQQAQRALARVRRELPQVQRELLLSDPSRDRLAELEQLQRDLAQAQDELVLAHLELAQREFSRAPRRDVDEDNPKRAGAKAALGAILDYLRAKGHFVLYPPLVALLGALDDADAGRRNPLITPANYRGGSKMRALDAINMANAAAAATILKDAGWPLDKALKEAAKVLGKDHKRLREFRKNLLKGRAPELSKEEYHRSLQQARSSSLPLEKQGDLLLRLIKRVTAPTAFHR